MLDVEHIKGLACKLLTDAAISANSGSVAVVLDLFSRRIVGWAMAGQSQQGETITAELACRALDMAWYSRLPTLARFSIAIAATNMPAVVTPTFSSGMGGRLP